MQCQASFLGRWNFLKVTSPRYSHFVSLRFVMQVIWGQVKLTWTHNSGKYYFFFFFFFFVCLQFCNITDIIDSQTHPILLTCNNVMSPYLICAFSTFCSITWCHRGPFVSAFFVNNFRSDRDRVENALLWWRWAPKSTDKQLGLPSSMTHSMTWLDVIWPWAWGSTLILPKKDAYIIRRG